MNQRLIGIYLVMKELLGSFSLNSFDNRLFLQRTIYLLQILGIDLRFRFAWHLRGPHSDALALCAFEINSSEKMKTDFNSLILRPEVLQILERLVQWMEKKPTDLSKSRWLELLSSIHYLKHISQPSPSVTPISVRKYLKITNTLEFCEQDIRAAWEVLNEAGLIDYKTLPRPETLYESNKQQELNTKKTAIEQKQEMLPSTIKLAEDAVVYLKHAVLPAAVANDPNQLHVLSDDITTIINPVLKRILDDLLFVRDEFELGQDNCKYGNVESCCRMNQLIRYLKGK